MSSSHRRDLLTVLAIASLQLVVQSVYAACGGDPECDEATGWSNFTSITLDLGEPAKPPFAKWRGRFDHATNDILIDVDEKYGDQAMKGSIALVGGYVMLTKGLQLERGYEIDALDGPILGLKLVTILLGREFPAGPSSIVKTKKISRNDQVGIKYASPSASGYIPAPWKLTGSVTRQVDGAVTYDLLLSFPAEPPRGSAHPKTQRMRMTGELAMLKGAVLPAAMSLADWTSYGVGPQEEQQGKATILDYGAKKRPDVRFNTVADVRAYITDEYGPGKPDPTRDFTGDWKEKCTDDFGLKIIRYGDQGKYAVLFCGPGGCDKPADQRLTYITGDKAYEVVGDDVILSGRPPKQPYVRCSRDPGKIRPVD